MEYRDIDYKIRQSSAQQFVDKIVSQNSQLSSLLNGPLTSENLKLIHNALKNKQSLTWNENVRFITYFGCTIFTWLNATVSVTKICEYSNSTVI